MNDPWIYKNFNMVRELDIAGEFIYNGISELNGIDVIRDNALTFFTLYTISVGIERLQKIILVLWKFDKMENKEDFEKSLITHKHTNLRDEIKKCTKGSKNSNLNSQENDLISLLQHFYKSARYERYIVNGERDIEIDMFNTYINKHIKKIQRSVTDDCIILTDDIKEFLGRVIGSISNKYYQLIVEGSKKNNTYTYELRNGSKAEKVFLGKYRKNSLIEGKLNERISFKELLIYLRNCKDKSAYLKFIEEIPPLDFDPPLVMYYIDSISKGNIPQELIVEVETIYDENNYSYQREQLVDLIGRSDVEFDYPYIDECFQILSNVIKTKKIDDDTIESINDNLCYIIDDDIVGILEKIKESYKSYKKENSNLDELLNLIKDYYDEYHKTINDEFKEV